MIVLKIEVEGITSYLPVGYILTELRVRSNSIVLPVSKTSSFTKGFLGGTDKNWAEKKIEDGDLAYIYNQYGMTATRMEIDF
jgi:hypothetical protein